MIHGNWVAIRKVFSKFLPNDRPYTKLEAVYSISLDFDSGNPASYSGYSKLWKWSRNKVKKFMDDLQITIMEPETPEEIRLQKGKLKGHPKRQPQDTPHEENGQPLFVFNKALHGIEDSQENKKGQPQDTPKDTTIDPIKIPNPISKKKSNKKRKPKTDPPSLENVQKFVDSISEATKKLCREKNIGQLRFKQIAETCFDHFRSEQKQKADWEATVRNWIRNSDKYDNRNQNSSDGDGSDKAQAKLEATQRLMEENES